MHVAFVDCGVNGSQVALKFHDSNFKRSRSQDGSTIFSSGGESADSGRTSWIGVASSGRAWACEASTSTNILPVSVFQSLRDAGIFFLNMTCGAQHGLETSGNFGDEAESIRIFAYDGWEAAVLVRNGRAQVCCQRMSSGTFSLRSPGVHATEDDSAFHLAARHLFFGMESCGDRGAVGHEISTVFDSTSSKSQNALVHITSARVVIQQNDADGSKEILSVHRQDDATSRVTDHCVIFPRQPSSSLRLVPEVRATPSENARPAKRPKRDPNRPRGYISAFNFFVQDRRPAYVQSHPDSQGHSLEHNNEINKTLGKVWKQATKQEKRIYEEKATADKLRYLHEMSFYRPPQGYERIAPRINLPKGFSALAWDQDLPACAAPQLCRPQPAYTHFAHQERNGVLSSGSSLAKTLMSKTFGQRWQGMPVDETELYFELEQADKARYEEEACAQESAASWIP